MNTKELIEQLQKLDPTGELEVVTKSNDGYVYDLSGVETGVAEDGILQDEDEELDDAPNCLVIDATN